MWGFGRKAPSKPSTLNPVDGLRATARRYGMEVYEAADTDADRRFVLLRNKGELVAWGPGTLEQLQAKLDDSTPQDRVRLTALGRPLKL